MKHRIAIKLSVYFTITLLLFAILIGGVFMMLFQSYTTKMHKSDLEARAVRMAATLSDYMSGTAASGGMGAGSGAMGGYGAYIRFLDDIAMADVWIVDENLELLVTSHAASLQVDYSDLPLDAEFVVDEVFLGKTTFSEGFSDLLKVPTITVGTPIKDGTKVIGALLLHSPVSGISEGIAQGFKTLVISISAALLLAIVLSVILAFAFTGPLDKMKNAALRLASGDYNAKTGVSQRDEIGELAATIDVLSERLDMSSRKTEQLAQLRRDFVANISHELRTPVTVIRGSLEALCDEVVKDPAQVKEYHRQMLSESIFLQRLVNDLLDLSRLQNADFAMEMQEISLCDVIREVVRSSGQMAKAKNITIISNTGDGQDAVHCVLKGDYGRLRQMFMIILDNAIKFSPENSSVTITFKDRTVSISDLGPGIPAEDLPFIFDRFYKVKSDENKNGTGLGLAIARQIADRHGIDLHAESVLNHGSRFIFQI
ncbi:MAG: HAMP domain-containing sensor histidine kinase [Saccharofermentanales bacterium]